GGMGEVWLASAEGPHGFRKKVVLKVVRQDLAERRELVNMLIREAGIAARPNHPNIVQVFDLDCVDGTYFFAMEHVPGYTMADIVRRGPRPPGAPAPGLLLAVVSAWRGRPPFPPELPGAHRRPPGPLPHHASPGPILAHAPPH